MEQGAGSLISPPLLFLSLLLPSSPVLSLAGWPGPGGRNKRAITTVKGRPKDSTQPAQSGSRAAPEAPLSLWSPQRGAGSRVYGGSLSRSLLSCLQASCCHGTPESKQLSQAGLCRRGSGDRLALPLSRLERSCPAPTPGVGGNN